MNQKFYTLEESLQEKSTDSPKPKRKRLARASPQVPASVTSGRRDDSVSMPLSQRFYSDISVDHPKYDERNVTEYSPITQHNPEPSSFIDASRSVDSSMPDPTAKRTNRWVYSANAPRKGDTQFNADRSEEPFLPEGTEKSYLPDEVESLGFGISTAGNPTSKPHDGKQKYGKIQGKEAITENGHKPRLTTQIPKDGKTQPEPQKSKSHLILHTAEDAAHQRVREDEEDNLGLQAVHETEQATETVWQHGGHAVESWKYRLEQAGQKNNAAKEARPAAMDYGTSNPSSKTHQREKLKRRYIKAHKGQKSAGKAARKTGERVEAAAEKLGEYAANHKHWIVILALGFLLVYVANSLTGCTPILGGVMDVVTLSTYPAEEADVRAAERVYLDMEKTLQDEIDHPEKYHPGCDEYYVTADKLWHDPYALISLISAYGHGEEWTVNSAYPTIEMLFHWQYDKKVNIHTETRHTTVTVNGETSIVSYTVRICSITVKNKNLSHAPMYIMDEERVSMYSLYMATLGNMPHVFAGQAYASTIKEPVKYDVPQETLDADPKFAVLVKEANKYLGYPYLWGGHHPNTGFDCAGFIYWIFNNSGVASFGHQGAQGLYDSSRKVSPDNARPGDVIFFSGTIEGESGISHCGLYVGNNRMIHCGNPCTYADLTDAYWQEHFAGYSRFY